MIVHIHFNIYGMQLASRWRYVGLYALIWKRKENHDEDSTLRVQQKNYK